MIEHITFDQAAIRVRKAFRKDRTRNHLSTLSENDGGSDYLYLLSPAALAGLQELNKAREDGTLGELEDRWMKEFGHHRGTLRYDSIVDSYQNNNNSGGRRKKTGSL